MQNTDTTTPEEKAILEKVRTRFQCAHIEIYRSKNAKFVGRQYYGLPGKFLCWKDEYQGLDRDMIRRMVQTILEFQSIEARVEQIFNEQ